MFTFKTNKDMFGNIIWHDERCNVPKTTILVK